MIISTNRRRRRRKPEPERPARVPRDRVEPPHYQDVAVAALDAGITTRLWLQNGRGDDPDSPVVDFQVQNANPKGEPWVVLSYWPETGTALVGGRFGSRRKVETLEDALNLAIALAGCPGKHPPKSPKRLPDVDPAAYDEVIARATAAGLEVFLREGKAAGPCIDFKAGKHCMTTYWPQEGVAVIGGRAGLRRAAESLGDALQLAIQAAQAET